MKQQDNTVVSACARGITRRQAIALAALGCGALTAGLFGVAAFADEKPAEGAAANAAEAGAEAAEGEAPAAPVSDAPAYEPVDLAGHELNIYCGAGMTNPFQEMSDLFAELTGCKMNVTFANAAQIQTQITTTEEGDFFISGSKEELKPVADYVASSTDLVKHIPVLIVPAENPMGIEGLADLAGAKMVLIGDPESTPIGKIAQKALGDLGIWESLQAAGAFTTTTTAPQIATAIANGEGDAGIVWKENAKAEGISIIEGGLDDYVKVIPAALLTTCADEEAAAELDTFLGCKEAQEIWMKFGYELVEPAPAEAEAEAEAAEKTDEAGAEGAADKDDEPKA